MANESNALPRTVSVLMPTFRAAATLDRVLSALASQETAFAWDFLAVDSGSDDGTLEIFARWSQRFPVPLRVHDLGRESFDHGDTRNLLAAHSAGELLVFLTDDAIPAADDWLTTLHASFRDPRVAAAYCRNVPRPDARAFARIATADDPTYASARREQSIDTAQPLERCGPEELRALFNYCDTASAVRRSLWERHPYPRSAAGEDVLLARALIEAGFTVVYDERACVLHSHDWSAESVRRRAVLDGTFNAEVFGRVCIATRGEVELNVARALDADRARLVALGLAEVELARELEHAEEQRRALYEGLFEGGQTRTRVRPTRLLDDARTHVAWIAGERDLDQAWTETARELRRRGHRIDLVLIDADDSQPRAELARAFDSIDVVARDAAQLRAALASVGAEIAHSLCDDAALLAELELPNVLRTSSGWRLGWRASPAMTQAIDYRSAATSSPDPRFEAALWEFRYRALACRASGDVLLDRWAREADLREGQTTPQGRELVVLGPEPGALEFKVESDARGPWRLEVQLETLAGERGNVLRGHVIVDGEHVGELGPLVCDDTAGIHTFELALTGTRSPRLIRIEVHADTSRLARLRRGAHVPRWLRRRFILRIRRVLVRRHGSSARARDKSGLLVRAQRALADREAPRVSVVIANLDGRELLATCLSALYASNFPAAQLDVVVADNGSRDASLDFLKREFPQVRALALGRNLGFTGAINAGAKACAGERVLVFLNNDVRVERDWLRELVAPIARGACAATGARMLFPDGTPEFLGGAANFQGLALGFPRDELARERTDAPRRSLFACGGAMAIDARAFADVGGLDDELFAYYDDLDLGWRLWVCGYEVHYVPSAVCRHARSSTSRTFPPEMIRRLQARNGLLACLKNYDDEHLERALPVLLALAARRLWIMAGAPEGSEFAIESFDPAERGQDRPSSSAIPRLAYADMLALNDILGRWDFWMEQRARVQQRRKRPDSEILPLFLDPLWCVDGERGYVELQARLSERFGIARMFAAPAG